MEHLRERRYLVSFDAPQVPQVFTDVLVIGSGVAGLRAALAAAEEADVLVIAKGRLDESNTAQAQGGIAGAMDPGDSAASHMADTLTVGQGLCDRGVVQAITAEAPERIRELIGWGAQFDREGGALALTREGGHSTSRIVHALGDATGKEVAATLIRRATATPVDPGARRRLRARPDHLGRRHVPRRAAPGPAPRADDRVGEGDDPRLRRRGPDLPRDDQPAGRDRRRHRDGLSRRRANCATWSSTSSIRPRSTSPARRAR